MEHESHHSPDLDSNKSFTVPFVGPPLPPENLELDPNLPSHSDYSERVALLDLKGVEAKDFFKEYPDGEVDNKSDRYETLSKGVTVFRDIGLTFYQVNQEDIDSGKDPRINIRKKLSMIPEFSYVADLPDYKLESFNIPRDSVKAGMLIPIPWDLKDRILREEQLVEYAKVAVDQLKTDPVYGRQMKEILESCTLNELFASMIAQAKQESGGKPLGQFAFHRYEHKYKAFSYSMFHIVQVDAGLRARRNLNMTEGQLYHPVNACKLFIAFIIEKRKRDYEEYLPISNDYNKFASMYNGSGWRSYNPNYVRNISSYYPEALAWLNGESGDIKSPDDKEKAGDTPKTKEKAQIDPAGLEAVGNRNSLYQIIRDLNWKHPDRPLKTNGQIKDFSERIMQYLKDLYKDDTYFQKDKMGIGIDEYGIFIIFERKNRKDKLRLKTDEASPLPDRARVSDHVKEKSTEAESNVYVNIRGVDLFTVIQDANWANKRPVKLDSDIRDIVRSVTAYLSRSFGTTIFYKSDKIALGKDDQGIYAIYQRGKQKSGKLRG